MTVRTIADELARVPGLDRLGRPHLETISGCGTTAGFAAGEYLFREDEQADSFYVIRHGTVSLEVHTPQGSPIVIETLHDGELVGWSWLFEPYRWHFDARATELTRLLAFDGACLRGKCDADHELGYALMRTFAAQMVERLQSTRIRLLDLYGSRTPA